MNSDKTWCLFGMTDFYCEKKGKKKSKSWGGVDMMPECSVEEQCFEWNSDYSHSSALSPSSLQVLFSIHKRGRLAEKVAAAFLL